MLLTAVRACFVFGQNTMHRVTLSSDLLVVFFQRQSRGQTGGNRQTMATTVSASVQVDAIRNAASRRVKEAPWRNLLGWARHAPDSAASQAAPAASTCRYHRAGGERLQYLWPEREEWPPWLPSLRGAHDPSVQQHHVRHFASLRT